MKGEKKKEKDPERFHTKRKKKKQSGWVQIDGNWESRSKPGPERL